MGATATNGERAGGEKGGEKVEQRRGGVTFHFFTTATVGLRALDALWRPGWAGHIRVVQQQNFIRCLLGYHVGGVLEIDYSRNSQGAGLPGK